MKSRRVILRWALAISILLGMFPALAGADAETGGKAFDLLTCAADARRIGELKWFDAAERETGVSVHCIAGPDGKADLFREVEDRIVSGTLPDAVRTNLTQIHLSGPKGAFMDLAPLLPRYAPHIRAYMDANPGFTALVTGENGAVYGLAAEAPVTCDFIGYRADHFRKAGIDPESVRTVKDFTNALRTLKAFYGKDNEDYHPLCGYGNPIRFAAWFGCVSSATDKKSGGVYAFGHCRDGSFDILDKNAYNMAATMKAWYKEGLIDPAWIDGAIDEAGWEDDFLRGKGSVFYGDFRRPQWFMENGGPEHDPDFAMDILNFLTGAKGRALPVPADARYDEEAVLAVSAQAGEGKAAAILSFLDFFYTDEGRALASYGVEGESCAVRADGGRDFIADYAAEESKPAGEKRWSFECDRFTVPMPVDDDAFRKWNAPLTREALGRLLKPENLRVSRVLKLTGEQAEELSHLVGAIYKAEIKGIVSFVNGSRAMSREEWATFQREMVNLGLKRIEKIQLDACRAARG